jgi:hypothetical protein
MPTQRVTVLLVHGAFTESASWNPVLAELRAESVDVVAVANPLRSLSGDAAYVRDVITGIGTPVVLVGHSYGGMVITEFMEEEMSDPMGDGTFLSELEIEVKAELELAESSRPEEIIAEPSAEWPFDPMDVQREEIGLRSLLGAIEAVEGGDARNDDRATGR